MSNGAGRALLWAMASSMFADELRTWRDELVESYAREPTETTLRLVAMASSAFYAAERHANPRVDSFEAAVEYVTTSLSVGYSNIFPVTPQGKVIASLLATFGPSMAAGLMAPPRAQTESQDRDLAEQILARLDLIARELERARVHAAAPVEPPSDSPEGA